MAKGKTTLSIDEAVTEQAKFGAWCENLSFSAYVERALQEYLTNHPPVIPGTPPQL